jgi:RimK family alpha-L-glutamate ligase
MKIVLITTRKTLDENKRIAEEAKKLHHEFVLLDLKELEYKVIGGKLIIDEFEGLNPDIVILRGIFNSIKSISSFVSGLRKSGVRVFDNNFLVQKYSINKVTDTIKLAQAGIPVPDTYHILSFDKFLPSAKEMGFPIVAKMTRTGKGAGVYKFNNEVEFTNFLKGLVKREAEPKNYLLQKFVDYVYDLRVLVIGKSIFCMRRIPGEGEFRANFSLGGKVELFDLDNKGVELALNALHAVDLEIGGVDLLIDKEDRRCILEVNHTPGMIGMEEATGQNITKVYLEYVLKSAK